MESSVYNSSKGSSRYEVLEVFNREIGFTFPKKFTRRICEAFVKRIGLAGKLNGHEGCVNTIEFNSSGDHLVSGSDDKQVIFWKIATRSVVFSYPSGHLDNVFQARIMPFTDHRTIVTSSADGQVRVGQVAENGHVETKFLGKHHGRVHKLAVEPGNPHIFYSCGEDGLIQHFDLRSNFPTKLFCRSSFAENNNRSSSSIMRLNTMVINPTTPNYFAVGGSDIYARIYDIRKFQNYPSSRFLDQPVNTFCPKHLIKTHDSHITGMAYSKTGELLVSYNDELIYLFQKHMGLGANPMDVSREFLKNLEAPQGYFGHRNSATVKGVNFFGPNGDYVISGSDCGHIFIWKKNGGKIVRVMDGDRHIVNQVEPHSDFPILASCGLERNIKLWAPMADDVSPPLPHDLEEIVESNRRGREDHTRLTMTPDIMMHVLRLHRRQALAYAETIHNLQDEDEDEDEGFLLDFTHGDSSLDLEEGNSTECSIS